MNKYDITLIESHTMQIWPCIPALAHFNNTLVWQGLLCCLSQQKLTVQPVIAMLCALFSLCSNICHNQVGAHGKLICHLQVYLVSNSGNIFMLCPVAPFGSRYHLYAAENMMASVSNGDAESFVSAAWLQQVYTCPLVIIYTPSQIIECNRILSKQVSLKDTRSLRFQEGTTDVLLQATWWTHHSRLTPLFKQPSTYLASNVRLFINAIMNISAAVAQAHTRQLDHVCLSSATAH